MEEKIAEVVIKAASSAAASKFVEKAFDAGQKWGEKLAANHGPEVVKAVRRNLGSFLQLLARKVAGIEENGAVSKEEIETAQDRLDFSFDLEKAVKFAAQTDSQEKHELLARALAEKLTTENEGIRSALTSRAIDVIPYLTSNQVKFLALANNVLDIVPGTPISDRRQFLTWLTQRLAPFADVEVRAIDVYHLEGMSCLISNPFPGDLTATLKQKSADGFDPEFFSTPLGRQILIHWNQSLKALRLTPLGQLIGAFAFDQTTGMTTGLGAWGD